MEQIEPKYGIDQEAQTGKKQAATARTLCFQWLREMGEVLELRRAA